MYDLGEIIRQHRLEHHYTQEQMARKINKSKSAISRYENGSEMPSLEALIDIAILFHLSLDQLAGLEKKESLSMEDLSPAQIQILKSLTLEFRAEIRRPRTGLTPKQLAILNDLIIEFQGHS